MACSPGAGDIDVTVKRREELSMRRLPTMMASASAAALTTLAVTVAVPALAGDKPGATPTGNGADALTTCLRAHGLDGVPDGPALKPWLGDRLNRGDATARSALEACTPQPSGSAKAAPGPSEQELRSCLKDHAVDVPAGDALALKQWVRQHVDDAAYRDAMTACGMAPPAKQ
jgi:hypothetical protein